MCKRVAYRSIVHYLWNVLVDGQSWGGLRGLVQSSIAAARFTGLLS